MHIEWNRVTWYSKLIAVIVFLVTAGVFFEIGVIYGSATTALQDFQQIPSTSVVYTNNQYGFKFVLPADWQGYSIVSETWNGYGNSQPGVVATGTELLVRNPKWTAADHYEDIPILIFTLAQWQAYQANTFSVSAAPFPASELGSNNEYVFALPPRWDYDYSTGYQEADAIVSGHPLQAFNL